MSAVWEVEILPWGVGNMKKKCRHQKPGWMRTLMTCWWRCPKIFQGRPRSSVLRHKLGPPDVFLVIVERQAGHMCQTSLWPNKKDYCIHRSWPYWISELFRLVLSCAIYGGAFELNDVNCLYWIWSCVSSTYINSHHDTDLNKLAKTRKTWEQLYSTRTGQMLSSHLVFVSALRVTKSGASLDCGDRFFKLRPMPIPWWLGEPRGQRESDMGTKRWGWVWWLGILRSSGLY